MKKLLVILLAILFFPIALMFVLIYLPSGLAKEQAEEIVYRKEIKERKHKEKLLQK